MQRGDSSGCSPAWRRAEFERRRQVRELAHVWREPQSRHRIGWLDK
jgi:hypothetical protein